jgi:hypothetical protein
MKFLTTIILTALLGYAATLYSAWWSFAITSLIVAVAIHQKPGKAFAAGFIAIALLHGIYATIINSENDGILAQRVANILPLGGSAFALILITAFVGGLISGLAALTGSFARSAVR